MKLHHEDDVIQKII